MGQLNMLMLLVLVVPAYSAPQFITFKDGKLGVNFGGYHAGVGLGGALGGGAGGAGGGLFAEAGTPHGQAAHAGLGGVVDGNRGTAGGLYAGATAGGNVKAAAGLGGVAAQQAAGGGFATAQAGPHYAASGLAGESSVGSAGLSFEGTKSYGAPTTVVKETEYVVPVQSIPVEAQKKIHTEFKVEAENEVKPLHVAPVEANSHVNANFDASAAVAPAVVLVEKEVVHPKVIQKHIIRTHYKPHRHHIHKTAYIGGFVGGDIPPPQIQRRVDVGAEANAHIGGEHYNYGNAGGVTYTKEVSVNRNPQFFQDILNIPISTLNAVGNFLSNTAAGTRVSVQKSASVQAESSPKHDTSKSSSSEAHLKVETPSASQIIDDIFAIPINTLGAVNKFLENNVANRKRIQVTPEGSEPTRIRLGPHARRRLNKQVVIVETEQKPEENKEDEH